jgi:hypothetical protein
MEGLEKEFGVKTIAAAEKLLKKMSKELDTKESDIKARFESLKEQYEW